MSKLIEDEPSTFEEASKHPEWKSAINEEYQSIMKNGVGEVVPSVLRRVFGRNHIIIHLINVL